MKPLAIFKPGKHTAMNGREISFSEQDVQNTVAVYHPQLSEAPLVIGHPETNDPAYGWVQSLQFTEGLLKAIPIKVSEEFASWVNAGFYKKISASFYSPEHPGNPAPGSYYLRHVGFLGGMPPAVKGLPNPAFQDTDEYITIKFSEQNQAKPALSNSEIAQRARDYHALQNNQGIPISFAEAVNAVHAMLEGNIPEIEIRRRALVIRERHQQQGKAISFAEAVDLANAIQESF